MWIWPSGHECNTQSSIYTELKITTNDNTGVAWLFFCFYYFYSSLLTAAYSPPQPFLPPSEYVWALFFDHQQSCFPISINRCGFLSRGTDERRTKFFYHLFARDISKLFRKFLRYDLFQIGGHIEYSRSPDVIIWMFSVRRW